ncbi:phosphatases II [Auricularia subglabra TFB-10046 SS5]|nr:phosphatases II [Auricularia subglabra TFB-10046 SS5]
MATNTKYFTQPEPTEDMGRMVLRSECTPRHIQWTLQANEVSDRIYVSDLYTATSKTALNDLGITHVISLLQSEITLPVDVKSHLQLHIADVPSSNILQHFNETTHFIRDALAGSENHRVLVHCVWGMSRSVSVAIAYLQATRDMLYHEAYSIVKERRGLACPNTGFTTQLIRYGVEVGVPGRRAAKSQGLRIRQSLLDRTPTHFGPQTNFPQSLSPITTDDNTLSAAVRETCDSAVSLIQNFNMSTLVDTVS